MKTILLSFKFLMIVLIVSVQAEYPANAQQMVKHQTRGYLNRTVRIIHAAKKQLEIGKNYTGDFARAVAHQKFARNLFLNGQFRKAVYQSHRARVLAFSVIRNNKGLVEKEFNSTSEEESLLVKEPKEEELDRDLMKSEPNLSFDDKAAARAEVQQIDEK